MNIPKYYKAKISGNNSQILSKSKSKSPIRSYSSTGSKPNNKSYLIHNTTDKLKEISISNNNNSNLSAYNKKDHNLNSNSDYIKYSNDYSTNKYGNVNRNKMNINDISSTQYNDNKQFYSKSNALKYEIKDNYLDINKNISNKLNKRSVTPDIYSFNSKYIHQNANYSNSNVGDFRGNVNKNINNYYANESNCSQNSKPHYNNNVENYLNLKKQSGGIFNLFDGDQHSSDYDYMNFIRNLNNSRLKSRGKSCNETESKIHSKIYEKNKEFEKKQIKNTVNNTKNSFKPKENKTTSNNKDIIIKYSGSNLKSNELFKEDSKKERIKSQTSKSNTKLNNTDKNTDKSNVYRQNNNYDVRNLNSKNFNSNINMDVHESNYNSYGNYTFGLNNNYKQIDDFIHKKDDNSNNYIQFLNNQSNILSDKERLLTENYISKIPFKSNNFYKELDNNFIQRSDVLRENNYKNDKANDVITNNSYNYFNLYKELNSDNSKNVSRNYLLNSNNITNIANNKKKDLEFGLFTKNPNTSTSYKNEISIDNQIQNPNISKKIPNMNRELSMSQTNFNFLINSREIEKNLNTKDLKTDDKTKTTMTKISENILGNSDGINTSIIKNKSNNNNIHQDKNQIKGSMSNNGMLKLYDFINIEDNNNDIVDFNSDEFLINIYSNSNHIYKKEIKDDINDKSSNIINKKTNHMTNKSNELESSIKASTLNSNSITNSNKNTEKDESIEECYILMVKLIQSSKRKIEIQELGECKRQLETVTYYDD